MKKLTAKQLAQVLLEVCENKTGDQLEETVQEFLKVLVSRQEFFQTHAIIKQIDVLWKEKFGVAKVKIETAYPLDKETHQKLIQILKGADLEEKINSDLIGGAKMRIDDRLLDGSVLGKLMALKQVMSK